MCVRDPDSGFLRQSVNTCNDAQDSVQVIHITVSVQIINYENQLENCIVADILKAITQQHPEYCKNQSTHPKMQQFVWNLYVICMKLVWSLHEAHMKFCWMNYHWKNPNVSINKMLKMKQFCFAINAVLIKKFPTKYFFFVSNWYYQFMTWLNLVRKVSLKTLSNKLN